MEELRSGCVHERPHHSLCYTIEFRGVDRTVIEQYVPLSCVGYDFVVLEFRTVVAADCSNLKVVPSGNVQIEVLDTFVP